MKRILLTTAAALLGLGALGFASSQNAIAVGADCATDLSAKLLEYAGGGTEGYTKLTTMFLTPAAQGETQYFHGGANALQRATYYNAGETALLMGNYDGTFAGVGEATGINSGYRNNDEEGVTHFIYTDDAATEANLFEAEHRTDGWKATGQRLGTYYRTLTQLSNSVKDTDWWWDDNTKSWGHSIENLKIDEGEYSDPLLKDFQYFAAPMMLQNNYFSWHSIRVAEASNYLSIRLYSTSSDAGKSTLVGGDEALISEARVYKGIHLAPKTEWVIKGIGDSDIPLTESPDLYLPEQYTLTTPIAIGDEFKLYEKRSATTIGINDAGLEETHWFGAADGENPGFRSKLDGSMTMWWKPTKPSLWIGVKDVTKAHITFDITLKYNGDADPSDAIVPEGKAVYITGGFTSPSWKATAAYKLTHSGVGKWTGSFDFVPGNYEWKPIVADATDPGEDAGQYWWPSAGNASFNFDSVTETKFDDYGGLTRDWDWGFNH